MKSVRSFKGWLIQSKTATIVTAGLKEAFRFLEQFGKRVLEFQPWLPQQTAILLGVSMGVTLLLRSILIKRFGTQEGRWWLPPGLVLLWGIIALAAVCERNPAVRKESRFFLFLKRWFS